MKVAIKLLGLADDIAALARAANADGVVIAADDPAQLSAAHCRGDATLASLEWSRALVARRNRDARDLRRSAESLVAAAPTGTTVVLTAPAAQAGTYAERLHSDMLAVLRDLCDRATPRGVRIAVSGCGLLSDTAALWRLRDAAQRPELRVVHDVAEAADPPTLAIKRLGRTLHEVRVPAAWCAANAAHSAEMARLVNLLRGIAYGAWLTIVPPDAAWDAAASVAWLRELLAAPIVPLTAYKGDKNAPRFVRPAAKETV